MAAALPLLLLVGLAALGASALTATVRVEYPDDQLGPYDALYLRGEGSPSLSWSEGLALKHAAQDVWTASVDLSAAGDTIHVKALINDSFWQVGANVALRPLVRTSGLSAVYPWFGEQTGAYEVSITNLYSKHFDNYRDVVVYTPPGYRENPLRPRYPLLVLQDGQNLFNDSTSFGQRSWRAAATLDDLIGRGAMEPVVVVGIYNTPKRILEYTYSQSPGYGGGGGDDYLDWVEQVALPSVQALYRVNTTSPDKLIGGSSLGGLLACYAGYTRPTVWRQAICMSSSFWWNSEDFLHTVMADAPPSGGPSAVYLDSGHPGDDYNETLRVRGRFEQLGFDPYYYMQEGGQHNEASWGSRFHVPMTDLFGVPPSSGKL